MIKYVRKRDGSKEEFSADKMQKWIEITATEGVNWSDLAFRAYRKLEDGCTSQDLHNAMVMACLDIGTEASLKVAGKFFISNLYKELFGGIENIPTIKEFSKGLWVEMDYSDWEYEELEKVINHEKDFEYSYTTLRQMVDKYFIRGESGERGKVKETPQFMFMGIAMAAMETMPKDRRLEDVKKLYNLLSELKINLPSPMLSNLRTGLRGYASCLTFMSDDTVESLGTGEHISYMMTAKSAGIGGYIHSRSIGDSVRKGQVKHMGKLPLYRQIDAAVHAMLQNGRGGAATIHYTCLDPEMLDLVNLKNPLTNSEKRIRGIDYSFMYNNVFAKAVAKNEDWLLISIAQAPDLYESFFSSDGDKFEEVLHKYLNSGKGMKVKARELALIVLTQSLETGRIYTTNIQEANRHTPFTETIYTSNLCQEIFLPTKPFKDMPDLYSKDATGLMGLCMLAGIVQGRVTEEEYEEVAYYCLLVIDKVIDMMEYPFPSLEASAKKYRSAGVGVVNLAYEMAKNNLSYTTKEGKEHLHYIAERHSYHLHKASLRLAKEFGVCEGMEVSKYPEGWLPIDTYNKNVDEVVNNSLKFDWEALRKDIKENGGIRNNVLEAIAPNESSSQLTNTCNGIYPIRQIKIAKSSGSNRNIVIAPESGKYNYEIVWNIPLKDQIELYAIFQKFMGQGISGDFFIDRRGNKSVTDRDLLQSFLYQTKMGMKSRYYMNSLTGEAENLEPDMAGCESGACSL